MRFEDENFLQAQSERLEGYLPGLPGIIEELNLQYYGRAIFLGPLSGKPDELIGYALPLQENQKRHLVVFKTGDILITEPDISTYPSNQVDWRIDTYLKEFSPSLDGMLVIALTIHQAIRQFTQAFNKFAAKTTLYNTNPDQESDINQAIVQAVTLGKKLKEQRTRAKETSAALLMGQTRSILGDT